MKMAAHISPSQRWSRPWKDKIPKKCLVEKLILLQFSEVVTYTHGVLAHVDNLVIQIPKHFRQMKTVTLTNPFQDVFMLSFSINWFMLAVVMCIPWFLLTWERFTALEEGLVVNLDSEISLLCHLMLIPVRLCLYQKRLIAFKINLWSS